MNGGRWTRLVLLLALTGLVVGSLYNIEQMRRVEASDEKLYYPSGRYLKEAMVGFDAMAADYLWFQTVQYYGGFRAGEHSLDYFLGLVDAVVQLDPQFVEGYYFSSLVCAMDLGNPEAAIDILKRGILANPDEYILHFNVGFTYYVLMRDYALAGLWFDAAARCPGATDFVRQFAAWAKNKAGDLESSRALWINLYETTSNPRMQELAEMMIADIESRIVQERGGAEVGR